jgi:hypothetical protein
MHLGTRRIHVFLGKVAVVVDIARMGLSVAPLLAGRE